MVKNKKNIIMENKMKFKTSINCGGCVAKVTPQLNAIEGIQWEVDITNPDKILTVSGEDIQEAQIFDAVRKVGFLIERV